MHKKAKKLTKVHPAFLQLKISKAIQMFPNKITCLPSQKCHNYARYYFKSRANYVMK